MAVALPEIAAPLKSRLLDAAEELVSKHGVKALTLQAVADQAGVSKGGLLYHFRSKSELVAAVLDRLVSNMEERQDEVCSSDSAPGCFTRAYADARTRPKGPGEKALLTALLAAASTDPQFLDAARAKADEWQSRVEADRIDPVAAIIVKLAVDGLAFSSLFGFPVPEGEVRTRVLEELTAMTHRSRPSEDDGQ